MKRSSYYDSKRNSHDMQSSDGEEPIPQHRYKSFEKRSRPAQNGMSNSTSGNEFYRYERYEPQQTSIIEKDQTSIAKKVIFYKNRDSLFQGIPVAVSRKKFPEFQSLLTELNKKITLVNGVRFIFRLEDGQKIESLDEIQGGEEYVVCSNSKLDRKTRYGASSPGKVRSSVQRRLGPSREHVVNNRSQYPSYGSPHQNQHANNKPLKFTVINNTYRSLKDKMIINPNTEQSFEELLTDMGEVVNIMDGPPTAIFRAKSPYTEITCFSALKTDLTHKNDDKRCEVFFICDDKGPPKEALRRQSRGNHQNVRKDTRDNYDYQSDHQHVEPMEDDDYLGHGNGGGYNQNPRQRGRQPTHNDRKYSQKDQQRENGYGNMHVSQEHSPRHERKTGPINRPQQRYRSPPRKPAKSMEKRPENNDRNAHPPQVQQRNGDRFGSEKSNPIVSTKKSPRKDDTPQRRRYDEEDEPESKYNHQDEENGFPQRNTQHSKDDRGKHHHRNKQMSSREKQEDRASEDVVMDGKQEEKQNEQISPDRNGREEAMDYEDEDDDDYDDEIGEPRAARKGPRIDTPEF